MRDTRLVLLWAGMMGAALLAGCGDAVKLRFNHEERYGKVYYLDGIGCVGFGREQVPAGFRSAGFEGDVEYWSWSATGTPLDQFGGPFVRARAGDLTKMIVMYRQTYPGRPISLVGLSAGTGVAVFACEQLPEGVDVDEVVLVASSLSEQYNLSRALRHIRGSITSYQTHGDLALGVLAPLTVTIDGAPISASAGLVGFKPPPGLTDEEKSLYSKVKNVPYSPSFSAYGFNGDHTSAVESTSFVRAKIAPIVMVHDCLPGTRGLAPAGGAGGGSATQPEGGQSIARR